MRKPKERLVITLRTSGIHALPPSADILKHVLNHVSHTLPCVRVDFASVRADYGDGQVERAWHESGTCCE